MRKRTKQPINLRAKAIMLKTVLYVLPEFVKELIKIEIGPKINCKEEITS